MNEYTVEWGIDIDAEDSFDAAMKALEIQRDPNSTATCFIVTTPAGEKTLVDPWEGK